MGNHHVVVGGICLFLCSKPFVRVRQALCLPSVLWEDMATYRIKKSSTLRFIGTLGSQNMFVQNTHHNTYHLCVLVCISHRTNHCRGCVWRCLLTQLGTPTFYRRSPYVSWSLTMVGGKRSTSSHHHGTQPIWPCIQSHGSTGRFHQANWSAHLSAHRMIFHAH